MEKNKTSAERLMDLAAVLNQKAKEIKARTKGSDANG